MFRIEPGTHTAFARRTLEVIESVHRIPPMPVVPISVRALPAGARNGWFDGTSIVINRRSSAPELTLAHEVGHAIDRYAIGQRSAGYAPEANDTRLDEWKGVTTNSAAVQNLFRLRSQGELAKTRAASYIDYAISAAELFARGYAQWIAFRSQSPALVEPIHALRASLDPVTGLIHWNDDDFLPIAAAFDRLSRILEWNLPNSNA